MQALSIAVLSDWSGVNIWGALTAINQQGGTFDGQHWASHQSSFPSMPLCWRCAALGPLTCGWYADTIQGRLVEGAESALRGFNSYCQSQKQENMILIVVGEKKLIICMKSVLIFFFPQMWPKYKTGIKTHLVPVYSGRFKLFVLNHIKHIHEGTLYTLCLQSVRVLHAIHLSKSSASFVMTSAFLSKLIGSHGCPVS